MSPENDPSSQAIPPDKYYEIEIDGKIVKIAHDEYQPGGRDRSRKAFSVVGAVFRAAREMRERDAAID